MFGSILILAVTLMHIYVFWRAASVPVVKERLPRWVFVSSCAVFWLVFFLGRTYGHGGSGLASEMVETAGMTWMAVLFLTTVPLLAIELVTGFGFFMPRMAPPLRGLAVIIGVALSVISLVQGLRPPEVIDHEVYLPGLPRELDGKVLVAVSDLHVGPQLGESWLKARIDEVMDLRPDMVALLGDLFEGHGGPLSELLPVVCCLSAPLGVWAVPGNHEFYGRNKAGLDLLEAAGVQVLLNRWVEVRPGLILTGVEDLTVNRRSGKNSDPLPKALADRPPGAVILLSHTPWEHKKAADKGVGLMLSGHTHGGQIWPFDYLVKLAYPLLEGRYEVGGMTAIVCRGTGTWGPRMRLWHAGEILRVTLRSMENKE